MKTYIKLITVLIFFISCNVIVAQNKSPKEIRDSLSLIQIKKAEKLITKGKKVKKVKKAYLEALEISPSNPIAKDKVVNYLLKLEDYKTVAKVLSRHQFCPHQHNELANHYYLLALLHCKRGWDGFHEAYVCFSVANKNLKKSKNPDLKLWSDVLNGLGYTTIVARSTSNTANDQEPFCIVHPTFINQSYPHFYYSTIYNPENEIAHINLETILKKIEALELDLPVVKGLYPTVEKVHQMNIAAMDLDSLNAVDKLDEVKFSMIPNNYQRILNALNEYDEVVLAMDISGSMDDGTQWSKDKPKFEIMKELSLLIAKKLKRKTTLGGITVGGYCDNIDLSLHRKVGEASRETFINQLNTLSTIGLTPLNFRLQMTPQLFSQKNNKKTVFMISDGMDSCSDNLDLCETASMLDNYGIDFSVFSFIIEEIDPESDFAFSIYECMVKQSEGKIFSVNVKGEVKDHLLEEIDNGLDLTLPQLEKSTVYYTPKKLFQFEISPFMK